jgi:hypothetical protein
MVEHNALVLMLVTSGSCKCQVSFPEYGKTNFSTDSALIWYGTRKTFLSADGQLVTFNNGLTTVNDEPFAVQDTVQGTTYIYAGSEGVSDTLNLPDDYLLIRVFTTGTGSWHLLANILTVWYSVDDTQYGVFVDGDTTTITITKYGEVGETIEGTFSSIVRDNGNTIEITDGQFRVKRVADDSVTFL